MSNIAYVTSGIVLVAVAGVVHAGCGGDSSDGGATSEPDGGVDATTMEASSDIDAAPGKAVCGNGTLEKGELCDDGNRTDGDGCDNDCTFTCVAGENGGLDKCGVTACKPYTCSDKHVCVPGTPIPDGGACGTGKVCNGGNCVDAVCGDKLVEPGEECDDGNTTNGDGCDSTCKFSCLSTDSTRNCASTDTCTTNGTCNDTSHTCTPGTAVPDGTKCTSGICKGGKCTAASCGDGTVESGEECDFGAGNGAGTGCETNCKFSCETTPSDTCVTLDVCKGTNACASVTVSGHMGQKCQLGAAPPDGTPCGNGGKCMGGTCQTTNCGNGTVDNGEQCDWGANNGPGVGCEKDCTFSCQTTPSDTCPSSDSCSANPEKCAPVSGPTGNNGQKCNAAAPLGACAACGNGGLNVCVNNACTPDTCGNGCVDATRGETCDPPGAKCDSNCHTIVCGDGVRSGSEQCDDGNTTNLDGCSSTCMFEQDQRANAIQMAFGSPSLCGGKNALGKAIGLLAQGTLNSNLATSVKGGGTTVIIKFLDLVDLSGRSQASVRLGSFGGVQVAGNGYDGSNDVDWWYTSSAGDLDGTRTPKSTATGSIAATVLTASGMLDFSLSLGGPTASHVHMWGANMRANVGGSTTPTSSSGGTPGHVASEHLDPTIQSFQSMSAGELCGNITAGSLDSIPIPTILAVGGSFACPEKFPTTSSLLDVLVRGCGVLITAAQPDQRDTSIALPGTPQYKFAPTNGTDVTSCVDNNGMAVDFQTCLDALAYSSDFTFTTDRVIAK